jgi:hypothetical protein
VAGVEGGRLLGLIVLVILVVGLYFYVDKKRYDASAYKAESGNNYLAVRFDKGNFGEYLTFNKLSTIKGRYKLMTNVYIPKTDGETTEIDLVCVHETGIYVFESKNYGGWIFGNEKSKYWTQVFKGGRKEKFYNPIWQNNTHIKHLALLLRDIEAKHFKSIIVFSERCTLKKLEVYSENIKVVNRYDLTKTINSLISDSDSILTEEQTTEIYNTLKPHTRVSDDVKSAHVENIKSKRALY